MLQLAHEPIHMEELKDQTFLDWCLVVRCYMDVHRQSMQAVDLLTRASLR